MFEKNRLFCIAAIVLCSGLSAGCKHAIDVGEQNNRPTENTIQKKTAAADSDFEMSSAEQIQQPGSNPAGVRNGVVGQPSLDRAVSPQACDSSIHGNSMVSTLRVWRDRDLHYATSAELLEIILDSKSVKLLKENGIVITVPIERLSEHDKNFLDHLLAAHKVESGKMNQKLVEQSR